VGRAPVLFGTRAQRDGLQRGEGLGARGPSRKTNAVLRTWFPVKPKKIAELWL
jgi:hypothetical protein